MNNCLIFTGNSNKPLAEKICKFLEKPLGQIEVSRFNDGEISVKIEENVRGKDVFIIQPTCSPVNENIMELLVMLDAFRRASPQRITAVVPYYGYARQDRKERPRVPITAKLIANLLVAAGAQRILTMDLHAPQIQGFFDIPVDHLFAAPVIINYLKSKSMKNPVIAAPDVGSVKMARAFAKRINSRLVIVDKRRDGPDSVEATHLIGEVDGCEVIIVDDLISTGSTVIEATRVLLENGASRVLVSCTHPVLSGHAVPKLTESDISEIIITDTIPHPQLPEKFIVLSVAELLGEAIRRIHEETSVSSLFI
ncbi:MAG: ribose-phosphate pyrophosphokinase [Candidatus Omnitrophica bacterium]|nr:ribose-phosphate pyrophosphokinase [Candidatus Omnitrophota bacterium]MCM8828077.1 ribose-phosphate pyrophosphokinase [Candidatus Omnitrophota bacterium]